LNPFEAQAAFSSAVTSCCGIGSALFDAAARAATNRPEQTTQTTAMMHKMVNITLKSGAYAVPLAGAGRSVRDRDSLGLARPGITQIARNRD